MGRVRVRAPGSRARGLPRATRTRACVLRRLCPRVTVGPAQEQAQEEGGCDEAPQPGVRGVHGAASPPPLLLRPRTWPLPVQGASLHLAPAPARVAVVQCRR